MKKMLLLCLVFISVCAKAQFVSIPDANFRNYLVTHFSSCFNASQMMDTTCNGIVNATVMDVGSLSISNLNGIQYFDNLQYLDVSFNQLTSVPVLPATVTTFFCNYNQLTALPDMPDMVNLNCAHNNIASLPDLPVILSLNCESNQLVSLPTLPIITALHCGGNSITALPSMPNVVYLHCENNQLTVLPVFSNTLYLDCSYNQLDSLPVLSSTLMELWCDNNYLKDLPMLPNTLTHLYCTNNKLFDLPALPNSLSVLYCYDNYLFRLPPLPNSLTEILCGTNLITDLPALSTSLSTLFCNDNKLLECLPKLPANLTTLFKNGTGITCIPNYTNFITSGILCSSTCVPHPSCSGIVFYDLNGNGIYDAGIDYEMNRQLVSTSTSHMASTSSIGRYVIKLDSGVVNTLTCKSTIAYSTMTSGSYTITPTTTNYLGGNYNFAVQLIPNVQDMKVHVALPGPARPGFNQSIFVHIENAGTITMNNSTLKVLKPSLFVFAGAYPAISTQVGDTLIWTNIDLDLFEGKTFRVDWNIPFSASIGAPYQIEAWALPTMGDTTAGDNHTSFGGVIQGSFDPNGKAVNKAALLETELGEELNYTVYFQNTGTDTAFNVIVRDMLSSNLDLTTFRMLGSSHQNDFQIRENGLLEVFFQDIKLVDSLTNEPASHGFFQYSVKPKSNLKGGAVIKNTAEIYFDYNQPIITNTVATHIVHPSSIAEVQTVGSEVYPNPTTGKMTLRISEPSATFSILDLNGRVLYQRQVGRLTEMDLSSFADGLYIGRINSTKGCEVVKIVKGHF